MNWSFGIRKDFSRCQAACYGQDSTAPQFLAKGAAKAFLFTVSCCSLFANTDE